VTFFDTAYHQGPPPWDIGKPQPVFVDLEREGLIRGRVLDAGCGTGENALFAARAGHETWGVDFAEEAIRQAKRKAKEQGVKVHFEVADALELEDLERTFDTILDSGLFHSFDDEERQAFTRSLAAALRPGGLYLMLCFNEHATGPGGPRRVTQAEIRAVFREEEGWTVREIRPAFFATRFDPPWDRTPAWLAVIERQAATP